MRGDVERRLLELMAARLGLDVPSADTDLFESGLIDSLTLVEVLVMLEEAFGVEIPLDRLEIDQVRSVRRLAQLVGT